jgi:hypothetical protein
MYVLRSPLRMHRGGDTQLERALGWCAPSIAISLYPI